MLRAVGALLLTGSGLALGLGAAQRLAVRRRELSDLAAALSRMEGELALSQPSTPVLLDRLAHGAKGPAEDFFRRCTAGVEMLGEKDFAQIWAEALEASGLDLTGEGKRQVLALGQALGRYDTQQLLRCCRQTRQSLETEALRTGEELRSQGKVYGTFGLTMGLLLAILLL